MVICLHCSRVNHLHGTFLREWGGACELCGGEVNLMKVPDDAEPHSTVTQEGLADAPEHGEG